MKDSLIAGRVDSEVPGGASRRDLSLDVAKGLAVLAMIVVHLVPFEGGESSWARAAAAVSAFLFDKPGPVFCLVSGMALVLANADARTLCVRAGLLFGFGVGLRELFPTEILSPLALLMLVAAPFRKRKPIYPLLGAGVVVGSIPVLHAFLGERAAADWCDDGSHLADASWGWVTFRYYLFDGNYGVLPWVAFTLLGMWWVRSSWRTPAGARVGCAVSASLLVAIEIYRSWSDARWADVGMPSHCIVQWEPIPSIPFVLMGCAAAGTVLCFSVLVRRLPGQATLASLGRTSLSHYVLHIVAVFVPLRAVYPEEDWSVAVGSLAMLGYWVVALPSTGWWLRRFRRGPLETLWASAVARLCRGADPAPESRRRSSSGRPECD